ncbi:MAG: hypothetical protein IKL47_08650 [Clostridia bacterium]|nr:hypothetical protein [Clostridia bacterium]
MRVKYNIEVLNECATDFWKVLTETFNVILIKKQHSIDGEILKIEIKIIEFS